MGSEEIAIDHYLVNTKTSSPLFGLLT